MFWVWEHWAACLGVGVPVRPVLIAILFRVFPLGWKGQVDSITLAKSFVRGGRDGRLRSAAATKSSPLRFCPFGLEDSALSFLWFWHGRSLFSAATASSWLAYRSAISKRSFTDFGARRASFLSRSGSLIPVLKEAMTTRLLAPGMVFFFFMNRLM